MTSASMRGSRPFKVSHSRSASAPALPLTARRLSLRSSLLITFWDSVITLQSSNAEINGQESQPTKQALTQPLAAFAALLGT